MLGHWREHVKKKRKEEEEGRELGVTPCPSLGVMERNSGGGIQQGAGNPVSDATFYDFHLSC